MFSESRERTVKGGGTVQSAAETAVAKQYEALLRVSQNLNSIRCSEELFKVLARALRAVVNFYVMGVGIYDETAHQVHLTSYGEPGDPWRFQNLRRFSSTMRSNRCWFSRLHRMERLEHQSL